MAAKPVQRVQVLTSFQVNNKRNKGVYQLFSLEKYTPVSPLKKWLGDKGFTKVYVDTEAKLLIEAHSFPVSIKDFYPIDPGLEDVFCTISPKLRVVACDEEHSLVVVANQRHIKIFNKLWDGTLKELVESSGNCGKKGGKDHNETLEEIGAQLEKEYKVKIRDLFTIAEIEGRIRGLKVPLKGCTFEISIKMKSFSKGIQKMLFEESKPLSQDNIHKAFDKVMKGVEKDGSIFCLETAILYLEENGFLKLS